MIFYGKIIFQCRELIHNVNIVKHVLLNMFISSKFQCNFVFSLWPRPHCPCAALPTLALLLNACFADPFTEPLIDQHEGGREGAGLFFGHGDLWLLLNGTGLGFGASQNRAYLMYIAEHEIQRKF